MQKNTKGTDTQKLKTAKATVSKTATSSTKIDKKNTEKKIASNTNVVKKTTAKKASLNKKTAKKSKAKVTSRKKTVTHIKQNSNTIKKNSNTKKAEVIEYYDLPYRYNQTIVKILAQTPTTFFVYWDIADIDRKKYENDFGKNFFETTVPVLIVHNKTMNYSFEIEINDFANCWYFNVADTKCNYEIELGRKAKKADVQIPGNYMRITSSNVIESPNNHILFDKNQKTIFYRNIKNNQNYKKDISQLEFMKYVGRIYNVYDVYKKIYSSEELQNIENNPSSSF